MKLTCAITFVVAGILVGNTVATKQEEPSKTRGFFDFLNYFGGESEPETRPPNLPPHLYTQPGPGLQPCVIPISTTTTPLPLMGPLCPLYPPQSQPGGQPLPPTGALVRPPPPTITGGTGIGIGGNVNVPLPERPSGGITVGLGTFQPRPELPPSVTGGTGIGIGGNVNVPPERPFGGVEVGLRPYVPPRPEQTLIGGTGVGIGGNVNVPLTGGGIPVQPCPIPVPPGQLISGGTGIGIGGNVNVPPERPTGGILVGPGPYHPQPQLPSVAGGTGIGIGGNVNVPPERPERPGGYFVGGPEPYPRPGASLTGGTGIGVGGNVNVPEQPERPVGILVGPGPYPRPGGSVTGGTGIGTGGNVNVPPERPLGGIEIGPRPYPPGEHIEGGTGVGIGGNVNVPPERPERPGGYFVGGPEPYPRPGASLTGGTGIGVGGNVNVPEQPERPVGILVGPGPYPRPGGSVTGGTGIGTGGNVNVPPERPLGGIEIGPGPYPSRPGQQITGGTGLGIGGNVNRPEPFPLPSELRPISSQPPPFVRTPVCPVGGPFPYVPQGFHYANPHLIPPQPECPLVPNPDLPPCSTMEMLDRLQLRTMYGYILKSGLQQLFQMTYNYTLFVPADPAFYTLPEWFLASLETDIKLLRAFILNHLIKVDTPLQDFGNEFLILNARPGGNRLRSNVYFPDLPYRTYTFDGSQVLLGDILTRNGRVNIVNKVIVPNPPRNAAQYLQEVPEFSKFMSAVIAANMIDLLQGPDPITLFIPFNEAFRDFDLQVLHRNATALRNFVNYHVVPGTFYSNGLLNGQHLATLYDKEIRVSVTSDGFTKSLTAVNNFNDVLKADVPLLNGVAHIISGVLSNVPDFYVYQEMNEFHTLNFGSLKRNSVVENNHLHEDTHKAT